MRTSNVIERYFKEVKRRTKVVGRFRNEVSALVIGLIPWLNGYVILERNAWLDNSVIDYSLICGERQAHLEVKSAVLREGHYAMYLYCPSAVA